MKCRVEGLYNGRAEIDQRVNRSANRARGGRPRLEGFARSFSFDDDRNEDAPAGIAVLLGEAGVNDVSP